jgi:general secretion pathway protein I
MNCLSSNRHSSPNGPRRRITQGFTLVEVIVAVAVVGITFGIIFQALAQGMQTIRRTSAYTVALQLTQNKMNELLIDDDIMADGVLDGRWNEDYWWRVELETREIDDMLIDKTRLSTRLLYIRLSVFYNFAGQERVVKLFSIKLVPKPQMGEQGYLGTR